MTPKASTTPEPPVSELKFQLHLQDSRFVQFLEARAKRTKFGKIAARNLDLHRLEESPARVAALVQVEAAHAEMTRQAEYFESAHPEIVSMLKREIALCRQYRIDDAPFQNLMVSENKRLIEIRRG